MAINDKRTLLEDRVIGEGWPTVKVAARRRRGASSLVYRLAPVPASALAAGCDAGNVAVEPDPLPPPGH